LNQPQEPGSAALVSVVDHLVFRVAELERTEVFYNALLRQTPERADGSLMYRIGDTRLFFTVLEEGTAAAGHDKESVGLNHMAFGVRSLKSLQTIAARLNEAGIVNSGIVLDRYGARDFIWLDDPNGMRVEFYLGIDDGSPGTSDV
jgi:glyoxylase I family protein